MKELGITKGEDELLREFAEYLYIDCMGGITLSKDTFIEAAISDLRTLIKQVEEERMPIITDEEIEKEFTTQHYHWEKGRYYKVRKDRIFGAKWMREWFRNRMIKGGE